MKRPAIITLLVLQAAVLSGATTGENENIQRVRDYWKRVWSEGNLDAVAQFYDPACKQRDDFTIEGFKRNVVRQRESFPDFEVEVHELFAHDNWVACRVTYRATHTGRKMWNQEPSGARIEVPGIDIFTFRDGKCVEHLHVADHLDLALQIGLKLTPTARAAGEAPPGG